MAVRLLEIHRWLPRGSVAAPLDGVRARTDADTFPVYPLLWHPIRTQKTVQQAPEGRVIGVEYSYDYQPSEAAFQESLGPNDVVWIPLYKGSIDHQARNRDHPRPEYEANRRALEVIAPRVRAVLVGSANAEISYSPCGTPWKHERVLDFIQTHGAWIKPFGRPAFAPVFSLLVYDCFHGGGKLRDALNDLNALVLSYSGCQWLFEQKQPAIPEPAPYPTLTAYLHTLNEAWSGVGLQKGLDAGSGEVLRRAGYTAGFMGSF